MYFIFERGILTVLSIVVLLTLFTTSYIPDLIKDVKSKRKRFFNIALAIIPVVSLFVLLLNVYAINFYPNILNEFGGGKPN